VELGFDPVSTLVVWDQGFEYAVAPPLEPGRQEAVAGEFAKRPQEVTTDTEGPRAGREARVDEHQQAWPRRQARRDCRQDGASAAVADDDDVFGGAAMRHRLLDERGWITRHGGGDEVRNARLVSGDDECVRYPSPCRWTDDGAVHEHEAHGAVWQRVAGPAPPADRGGG
jgi:hypothetical protein